MRKINKGYEYSQNKNYEYGQGFEYGQQNNYRNIDYSKNCSGKNVEIVLILLVTIFVCLVYCSIR